MKLMNAILLSVIVTFCGLVAADGAVSLDSSINIKKVPGPNELYAFEICNAGNCIPLGNSSGYSADKIEALSGRWQQLGAVGMGLIESLVIVYSGGTGLAMGYGSGSFLTWVGSGAVGVLIPSAAVSYISALNPVTNFSTGGNKAWIRNSVNRMVYDGTASLVLYTSPDWIQTRAVGTAIERVLINL